MDFSRSFRVNALVGSGLAFAVFPRGGCDINLALSRRDDGLRISRCVDCTKRVWVKSAKSASGDARSHRYAADFGNFSHWPVDLAKSPTRRSVEQTRPLAPFRVVDGGDVDQRANRLG